MVGNLTNMAISRTTTTTAIQNFRLTAVAGNGTAKKKNASSSASSTSGSNETSSSSTNITNSKNNISSNNRTNSSISSSGYGPEISLPTTFVAGNGGFGAFFAIQAVLPIRITSIDFHTDRHDLLNVEVYTNLIIS